MISSLHIFCKLFLSSNTSCKKLIATCILATEMPYVLQLNKTKLIRTRSQLLMHKNATRLPQKAGLR